ncbi:phage head closure protein [Massilia sp. UMI-21]|nr:phage head closure protein [Massilia sp. UMI-21]
MAAPVRLNERATIQERTTGRDPEYGTEVDTWVAVHDRIWCEAQDVLPSRGETVEQGRQVATMRTRLRIRKQIAIAPEMRVILHGKGDRVMQVISGPAYLDDKTHVECMLEGYSDG